MKTAPLAAVALSAILAGPGILAAQGGSSWWRPVTVTVGSHDVRTDADRDRAWSGDRRAWHPAWERGRGQAGDVRRGTQGRKKGNGPPFCRNGRGHPVHGWAWCVEKGWAPGGYGWGRAQWGDVILRGPAPERERRMGRGGLLDVLGRVVLGRLVDEGHRMGIDGAVDGRWLAGPRGASVLQLRMGGSPLAEIADADRDGRVDLVLLPGTD